MYEEEQSMEEEGFKVDYDMEDLDPLEGANDFEFEEEDPDNNYH